MNGKLKNIETNFDEDIINTIKNIYRSNSCRGNEMIFFPMDFVPKLKPKIHGTLPSPMNLGLKCNKLHIQLEKLALEGGIEYNSDIENYFHRSKPNLKAIRNDKNLKFKTNKNLVSVVGNIDNTQNNNSSSPAKKVSLRQFKLEDFNLVDEVVLSLEKQTNISPNRKTSILNHMERKISMGEDMMLNN